MRITRHALGLLGAVLLATPAGAATLKPYSALTSGMVRLSDLWDGVENDRPLGPAPAPGSRLLVEAPQLDAIARQFGVAWRASSVDRAVLERPGQLLGREQALAVLHPALQAAGMAPNADLELSGWAPPMVPLQGCAAPEVAQADFERVTGRFTALLSIPCEGQPPVQARIVGRITETTELPVAARRLLAGTVLTAADLQPGRVRTGEVRADSVRVPQQAVGMAVRHATSAGQMLLLADLVRPPMIEKGAVVRLALETGGLSLAAQGIATETGALGERIKVMNVGSRMVLDAEITGPGRVRVIGPTMARVATR